MDIGQHILTAMIVGFLAGYLHKPSLSIAHVNIELLVKTIIRDIVSQDLSKDEVRFEVQKALIRLAKVIKIVALQKKVVVLNRKTVLALSHSIDITSDIAKTFNEWNTK